MLKFYEVDGDYINYLREYGDNKVPMIDYEEHKKFFCGIVLNINNFNYFAPVSSYNKNVKSVFLIKDKNKLTRKLEAISSLRFSFMFPCPKEYLTIKDFSKEDIKYRRLLEKELHFCNVNIEKIKKKADEIYKLGSNSNMREKYNICNFKLLEEKCMEYINKRG